MVSMNSRN